MGPLSHSIKNSDRDCLSGEADADRSGHRNPEPGNAEGRPRQRTDLIIGGVIFVVGLLLIFGYGSADIGLMVAGIGLILIGVQDKPRMSYRWVRYSGLQASFSCCGDFYYSFMYYKRSENRSW